MNKMFPSLTNHKISTRVNNQIIARCFSSDSTSNEGFFSRLKNTLTGKAVGSPTSSSSSLQRQKDQYAKQISDMANTQSWTLTNFHNQIKEASGGWRTKLPGMGSTDAVKQMKAMQQLLEATMEVVGYHASVKELKELGKKEKVRGVIF
jgi:hypothetical protein